MIGHENEKRLLLKLYENGSIPPFLIFEGPMGVGKAQMAYAFASLIMYDGKKEPIMSPDFYLVQPMDDPEIDISVGIRPLNFDISKDIRIDKIRELEKELSKKGTFEASMRVVLVLNGENLNTESQNSFLKTLEEPPHETVIIMVISHRERILPTVYSRGKRFTFGPLKFEEFKEYPFEGQIPVLTLYSLSGGSIGRAKKIESSFVFSSRLQFIKNLARMDFLAVYDFMEEVAVDKAKTLDFLDMLSTLLRDVYVIRHGGEPLNEDIATEITDVADTISEETIEEMLKRIRKAYTMVEANVQRRYVLLFIIAPLFPNNIRDKYDATFDYLWEF